MDTKKMFATLGAMSVLAAALPLQSASQPETQGQGLILTSHAGDAQNVNWHSSHSSHASHSSHSSHSSSRW